MKQATLILAALACLSGAVGRAQADYIYAGSWDLATIDGGYANPANPYVWNNNPPVFSALQAAAMLFGGSPSDYAISTVDNNPAHINHLAFVDGWGDPQYLFNPTSESFSKGTFYNNPGGFGTAYSAYVVDHAPFERDHTFVNFAFRNVNVQPSGVPEPASFVLFALAGGAVAGYCGWRRKRAMPA
jgi:hypothetical protein